jgi:hypothetical protein
VFVGYGNIDCTLKWPNLKANVGEMKKSKFSRIDSWSQSYQTFFFVKQRFFLLFASKLGYFNVLTIFSYAANTQAKQRKSEK